MPTSIIAGIDEVGRGCLAGPVFACAVAWNPAHGPVTGVRDSKKLSAKRRLVLSATILESAWVGLGVATVMEVDTLNIWRATEIAMQRALRALPVRATHAIVDGDRAPNLAASVLGWENQPTVTTAIGGDDLHPQISAASIVAKVARDQLMAELAHDFPGYGWDRNAGYGTAAHIAALSEIGITKHHRKTFAPVRQMLADHPHLLIPSNA